MASAKIAGQHIAGRQQQDVVAFGRVQQRPDFRAKQKALRRLYQIERLHPERVARGKKVAGRRVDRNEGIHAGEAFDPVGAPGPQHVGDDFRVAFGAEAHAERLQFLAQFDVIVDFAVEGDEKAFIERRLRLHAMCRIDNPQAARAHRDIVSDRDKWIGNVTSMQHARDQTPDGRFAAIPIDGNRYTAHAAPENADGTSVDSLGLTTSCNYPKGRRVDGRCPGFRPLY